MNDRFVAPIRYEATWGAPIVSRPQLEAIALRRLRESYPGVEPAGPWVIDGSSDGYRFEVSCEMKWPAPEMQ